MAETTTCLAHGHQHPFHRIISVPQWSVEWTNESVSKTWTDGLFYGREVGQQLTPPQSVERGQWPSFYSSVVPGGTVLGPSLSWGLPWDPEGQKKKPKKGEEIQIGNSMCSWQKCVALNMTGSRLRQKCLPLSYLKFAIEQTRILNGVLSF